MGGSNISDDESSGRRCYGRDSKDRLYVTWATALRGSTQLHSWTMGVLLVLPVLLLWTAAVLFQWDCIRWDRPPFLSGSGPVMDRLLLPWLLILWALFSLVDETGQVIERESVSVVHVHGPEAVETRTLCCALYEHWRAQQPRLTTQLSLHPDTTDRRLLCSLWHHRRDVASLLAEHERALGRCLYLRTGAFEHAARPDERTLVLERHSICGVWPRSWATTDIVDWHALKQALLPELETPAAVVPPPPPPPPEAHLLKPSLSDCLRTYHGIGHIALAAPFVWAAAEVNRVAGGLYTSQVELSASLAALHIGLCSAAVMLLLVACLDLLCCGTSDATVHLTELRGAEHVTTGTLHTAVAARTQLLLLDCPDRRLLEGLWSREHTVREWVTRLCAQTGAWFIELKPCTPLQAGAYARDPAVFCRRDWCGKRLVLSTTLVDADRLLDAAFELLSMVQAGESIR